LISSWIFPSYIINYNLGQDIVRTYIEKTASRGASLERKWQVFYEILSTPRTPSGLQKLELRTSNIIPFLSLYLDGRRHMA
jgi:hypothetical protein